MIYTVSDFLSSYRNAVRMLAGEGGLARSITEVGILDYELVPGMTRRYQRKNFYRGQLVLSSFLYARDSPYLVTEAVKHLVSVGASGLVIKNVFRLDIPDAALRYANARNFPLMETMADDEFLFDVVIVDVGMRVRRLGDFEHLQHELDALIDEREAPELVTQRIQALNPSLDDMYAMVHILPEEGITQEEFTAIEYRYRSSGLASASNLLVPFDDGLLYVLSCDELTSRDVDRAVVSLRSDVLDNRAIASLGVSAIHQGLGACGHCLLEARHAAHISELDCGKVVRYADLGILRVALPHANDPVMCAFACELLDPLRDFDVVNKGRLVETLDAYLRNGRSIDNTAMQLGTHPNTVRYRLGQVSLVTGLDWRNPCHMEQLSLAHAIERAQKIAG